MKLRFLILLLLGVLLVGASGAIFAQQPSEEKFDPVYATILKNEVNIRAGCGLNFEILGRLDKTDEVAVVGEKFDWYKIGLPERAVCFVHRDYIDQGVVKAARLRVRAANKYNANVLGILKKGQTVRILSEEGEWLKIMPPDNCTGWVKKDYLRLTTRRFMPPKFTPIPIIKESKPPQELAALPQREKTKTKKAVSPPKVQKKKGKGFFSFFKKKTKTKKGALAPKAKGKIIEVCGKVEDLGKIFNCPGTHKLIEGKKNLYYLKSDTLDLNLYVYDRVCLTGNLIESKKSAYPLLNVEQIK